MEAIAGTSSVRPSHPYTTEGMPTSTSMAGFIDQKFYAAPDGERVTVVRFVDEASHRAWARHPEHLRAQRRGRDEFYSWYDISVAEESHGRTFANE